jgi:hypothetical protein
MQVQIDARKVAGVVKETNDTLLQHPFNPAEVIIGLSELIGRIIVQYGTTSIQIDELKEVVINHLNRTTSIGAHASGKGPLERV